MNNTYTSSDLLKQKLFLERLFLLDAERQNQSNLDQVSSESVSLNTDDYSLEHQVKPKSINFVSIYAIAVTLLLVFPHIYDFVNSNAAAQSLLTVELTQEQEQEQQRVKLLESRLQELEFKTQILQSQLSEDYQPEFSTIDTPDNSAQTDSSIDSPSIADFNVLNYLPESHPGPLPLSIPQPPAPTITTDQSVLLPVPALPAQPTAASNSAQSNLSELPPPPPIVAIDSNLIVEEQPSIPSTLEPHLNPSDQWLGQTDTVYYSGTFQKALATHEEPEIDQSLQELHQILSSYQDLNQYLASSSITHDFHLSKHDPGNENLDLALDADSEPSLDNELKSQIDSLEELPDSDENQPKLFSDADLANFLNSSLLDDKIIQQTLETNGFSGSEPEVLPSNNADTLDTEIDQALALLQQNNSGGSDQSTLPTPAIDEADDSLLLFADEDLKQLLNTPLFSDDIIKQKLK